jgi:hypothetical protein
MKEWKCKHIQGILSFQGELFIFSEKKETNNCQSPLTGIKTTGPSKMQPMTSHTLSES